MIEGGTIIDWSRRVGVTTATPNSSTRPDVGSSPA